MSALPEPTAHASLNSDRRVLPAPVGSCVLSAPRRSGVSAFASAALLVACLLFAGCLRRQEIQGPAFQRSAPAGEAVVYVYRPGGLGGRAEAVRLEAPGFPCYELYGGGYVDLRVAPGALTVTAAGAGGRPGAHTVVTRAGEEHYLRLSAEGGLAEVSAEVGQEEIASARLAEGCGARPAEEVVGMGRRMSFGVGLSAEGASAPGLREAAPALLFLSRVGRLEASVMWAFPLLGSEAQLGLFDFGINLLSLPPKEEDLVSPLNLSLGFRSVPDPDFDGPGSVGLYLANTAYASRYLLLRQDLFLGSAEAFDVGGLLVMAGLSAAVDLNQRLESQLRKRR
jgi:hypothetical protein